ncbi:MAG: histidine kinase, partial [Bacteroidota bacterium]
MTINLPRKYAAFSRHLAFWLVYCLYQVLNDSCDNTEDRLIFNPWPQYIIDIPMAMVLSYINLYLLLPVFYYKRRYVNYIGSLVLMLLAGGLIERYISYRVWIPAERIFDPAMYQKENKDFWIPLRILRDAVEIYPAIALSMLIKLMRSSYLNEKKLRAMEKEKFEAELGLLKAQINPHFFFNTLNSLYALTLRGAEAATGIVLRLSDLMHYMLYEASESKVLLQQEITHLENYISIEQLRFADRLDLSFQYSGDIEGKWIAPLLLLPFVENAFKHGIEDNSGWITIDLKLTGGRLFLKVANSYFPPRTPKGKGLGIRNVKRRLELIYPGRYALDIRQHP